MELEKEERGLLAFPKAPARCSSSGTLEKQHSMGKASAKGCLDDGPSPIRITPAVSRQASLLLQSTLYKWDSLGSKKSSHLEQLPAYQRLFHDKRPLR